VGLGVRCGVEKREGRNDERDKYEDKSVKETGRKKGEGKRIRRKKAKERRNIPSPL
jgi:hypothetical protein